jgi:hypothetical protein
MSLVVNESRHDRQAKWGRTLNFVAKTYNHIRNLEPIVAINYNDEEPPNAKLNYDSIAYLIDVDNAVQKSISNDPSLYAEWLKLVNGEAVGSGLISRLANKLGRCFEARELHPVKYFRTIKRNSPGIPRVPLPVAA